MKNRFFELDSISKLKQATLSLSLVICLGIAFSIYLWATEPDFRIIKADITNAEAYKARQVLDLYKIEYRLNLAHGYLRVDESQYPKAIIALKSVGIDLPPPTKHSAQLVKAMESAQVELDYLPVYQQPWFMKTVRLCLAALVICVLLIVVIRPFVKELINGAGDTEKSDEAAKADQWMQMSKEPQSDIHSSADFQLDRPTKIKLATTLGICFSVIIAIVIWVKEPEFRVLINDVRTVDAVKVYDTLEQHDVSYKTDSDSHILYVAQEDANIARLALTTIDLDIVYPEYIPLSALEKSEKALMPNRQIPFYQQPIMLKMFKLGLAAIVIIIIMLVIVRPLLRIWIFPEDLQFKTPEDGS